MSYVCRASSYVKEAAPDIDFFFDLLPLDSKGRDTSHLGATGFRSPFERASPCKWDHKGVSILCMSQAALRE
jgi:hypothetical protein